MHGVIEVVAAILWRNGKFLAVRRPEGKPMAGYWEFPGGKVEEGEGLEEALLRELAEELAVRAAGLKPFVVKRHDYEHARVRLHFYQGSLECRAPSALEEQELAWFSPQEAMGRRFLPADFEVLGMLAREHGKEE